MEGNQEIGSTRWKPTKTQKNILEQLFNAGERNPSRKRVNEITNMLRVHSKVEAKNVSYWFQNSHSRRKRKEQRDLMQQLSHEQNEIAGSYQAPIRFSPPNASVIEPSMELRLSEFPLQELTNSREYASSIPTKTVLPETLLPVNLSLRPNLQLLENEVVCHNNRTVKKQKLETKSKGEYTINQKDIAGRSPGTICSALTNASSGIGELAMSRASFSPKILTSLPESVGNETVYEAPGDFSNIRNNGVISEGWLRHFIEGRRSPRGGYIFLGSEPGRDKNNIEELELFPVHSDGKLKSQIRQQD